MAARQQVYLDGRLIQETYQKARPFYSHSSLDMSSHWSFPSYYYWPFSLHSDNNIMREGMMIISIITIKIKMIMIIIIMMMVMMLIIIIL